MRSIDKLATESKTEQHELILEMLEHYGVSGTLDLTEEQIEYYAEHHGDDDVKIYEPHTVTADKADRRNQK